VKIPVFYNEKQTAKKNSSFSPSAQKPAKVVKAWQKNFGDKIEVIKNFNPAHFDELCWVHDREYVHRVMSLEEQNGFGNKLPEIRDALPWVSGSMLNAIRWAVWQSNRFGANVAFSPTSGAHHAGYDFGGGFCTFNFIAMAIKVALDMGKKKIGILDFDAHYGNGTQNIIDVKGWNDNAYQFGTTDYNKVIMPPGLFFDHIGNDIPEDTDFLIYNAGADAHINDPLGGVFSTEDLQFRDQKIFELAKDRNIGVVVSLAGGYQHMDTVLEIHNNTMAEAIKVFEEVDVGTER